MLPEMGEKKKKFFVIVIKLRFVTWGICPRLSRWSLAVAQRLYERQREEGDLIQTEREETMQSHRQRLE